MPQERALPQSHWQRLSTQQPTNPFSTFEYARDQETNVGYSIQLTRLIYFVLSHRGPNPLKLLGAPEVCQFGDALRAERKDENPGYRSGISVESLNEFRSCWAATPGSGALGCVGWHAYRTVLVILLEFYSETRKGKPY